MAPGRKRGAKGVMSMSDLSLGDLVLAKVKGFPPWPAKVDTTPMPSNLHCNCRIFCFYHMELYEGVFS